MTRKHGRGTARRLNYGKTYSDHAGWVRTNYNYPLERLRGQDSGIESHVQPDRTFQSLSQLTLATPCHLQGGPPMTRLSPAGRTLLSLGLTLLLAGPAACSPALAADLAQPPPFAPATPTPEIEAAHLAGQADPASSDEQRIQAAVQTYFDLKAGSFVAGEALDLGIVVDRSTKDGAYLYNYEVGLLQYYLTAWECDGYKFTACAYTCTFDEVTIDGDSAQVSLRLSGHYECEGGTAPFGNLTDEPHSLSLIRSATGWKLITDVYDNQWSQAHPRGTDFATLTWAMLQRLAQVSAGAGPQPPPLHPGLPAPELETAYQASQADPNLSDDEKIKAAIQTYFDLKARSVALGDSLDLGFVIDHSTEAGTDLYNYELGLLQYNLAAWRYNKDDHTGCEYKCEFISIKVNGNTAEVKLELAGEYRHSDTAPVARFSGEPHTIALVRTTKGWQLVGDIFENETADACPRGTDFAGKTRAMLWKIEVQASTPPPAPDPPAAPPPARGVAVWIWVLGGGLVLVGGITGAVHLWALRHEKGRVGDRT
jgi:hypothetical protein